jgi:hypothetical protein
LCHDLAGINKEKRVSGWFRIAEPGRLSCVIQAGIFYYFTGDPDSRAWPE